MIYHKGQCFIFVSQTKALLLKHNPMTQIDHDVFFLASHCQNICFRCFNVSPCVFVRLRFHQLCFLAYPVVCATCGSFVSLFVCFVDFSFCGSLFFVLHKGGFEDPNAHNEAVCGTKDKALYWVDR